jgi:DNA mismatch endonuclease (patch repair protein)
MKSKNTYPEKAIQFELRRQGLDFKTHVAALPGTPDIVLAELKTVIFVNGCYWHRHFNCTQLGRHLVKKDYWLEQFSRIVASDYSNVVSLQMLGWTPVTVWECEAISHPARFVKNLLYSSSNEPTLASRSIYFQMVARKQVLGDKAKN